MQTCQNQPPITKLSQLLEYLDTDMSLTPEDWLAKKKEKRRTVQLTMKDSLALLKRNVGKDITKPKIKLGTGPQSGRLGTRKSGVPYRRLRRTPYQSYRARLTRPVKW